MLRTPRASERIQMTDPTTGIAIIQLTSYPTPSFHFMYDWPSVTPDNRRIMFYGQRYAARSAPWDLFRVDADGLELFQITERENASRPTAVMTLDGALLYAIWPEDGILRTIDVETGRIEDLMDIHRWLPANNVIGGIRMAGMGTRLFVSFLNYVDGGGSAIRIELASGTVKEYPEFAVHGCFQENDRLIILRNFQKLGTKIAADGLRIFTNANPEPMTLWSVDEDGGDAKYLATVDMFGHSTMLGKTSKYQGTGQPPNRCIWVVEPEKEPEKLVQGPYFWHSGPSFDGEWIVSDTNWPDEGLKLIHVPTRRWRTLCHAGASQGHTQYGHCHPALSQDGRLAVFTSDRTGVTQVYVARITDEFRESVKAGELDRPRDKWI